MATLHLRDVPDETVEQLRRIAASKRMSVTAVAVQELIEAARACDNAALLESLPNLDIGIESIVAGLDAGRAER